MSRVSRLVLYLFKNVLKERDRLTICGLFDDCLLNLVPEKIGSVFGLLGVVQRRHLSCIEPAGLKNAKKAATVCIVPDRFDPFQIEDS